MAHSRSRLSPASHHPGGLCTRIRCIRCRNFSSAAGSWPRMIGRRRLATDAAMGRPYRSGLHRSRCGRSVVRGGSGGIDSVHTGCWRAARSPRIVGDKRDQAVAPGARPLAEVSRWWARRQGSWASKCLWCQLRRGAWWPRPHQSAMAPVCPTRTAAKRPGASFVYRTVLAFEARPRTQPGVRGGKANLSSPISGFSAWLGQGCSTLSSWTG